MTCIAHSQTRFREYLAQPRRISRAPKSRLKTVLSPSPSYMPAPGVCVAAPPKATPTAVPLPVADAVSVAQPTQPTVAVADTDGDGVMETAPEGWLAQCHTPTDTEPCESCDLVLPVAPGGSPVNGDGGHSNGRASYDGSDGRDTAPFPLSPSASLPPVLSRTGPADKSATLPRARAYTSSQSFTPPLDRRRSLQSFDESPLSPARTFETPDKVTVRRNTGRKLPQSSEAVLCEAAQLRRVMSPASSPAMLRGSSVSSISSAVAESIRATSSSPQSAPSSPFRSRPNGVTLPASNLSSDA